MKKRIVSLLMAICMASTLMPIQSFAQEGDAAPLTTEASVNAPTVQTPPAVGEAAPQSPTPRAKETVTITGLERDNVRTYYNGKPHAGKLTGAVVQDNKVPVEELVCTYTGGDKNTIYGPSTTPPTNAGDYEMVVSVAESNPTYTGQSATVYITIQKTGISLSSSTEVASKVYDGTTSATINKYAFSSLVKGEELILDTDFEITTPPVYSSADAGTADIHFTMALKDTPKAKNYELPYPDWGFAGESLAIKKKPLTKGTITPGREKPYDGNGDFTDLSATYEGGITGENVTGKVNGLKLTADAGSGALYVTKQTLDATYAKNYAVPENSAVTGNVEILKISPVITLDAPSTQKVGKDVTVTMTITNPAGATTGFPVMNDVSIVADANATAKGIVTQIGTTGVYEQIFTIDATAVDGAIVKFTASVPKDITNYKANTTGAEKTLTVSDKYTLTVTGGTGGGSYEDKAKVTITADAAPSGKVFDKWTTADGVVFKDANAAETTITMPKKDATVTANYKVAPAKTYTLTVTGGTGGGSYAEKANVTITAGAAPSGKVFDKWTTADGVVFKDANAAETTITMPKKDATVTANYKAVPVGKYTLTVTGGTGGGSYAEKSNVTITADKAPSGKVFDKWTTADGVVFKDANAAKTTITMPKKDAMVKANYKTVAVTDATVNDTNAGTTVTVNNDNLSDAAITDAERNDPDITKVDVTLNVVKASAPSEEDKNDVSKQLFSIASDAVAGAYFDITIEKIITKNGAEQPKQTVKNTGKLVRITITIPENMRGGSNYTMVRVHMENGVKQTEILKDLDTDPNTITIESDKFSTYAIAYSPKSGSANTIDYENEFWIGVTSKIAAAKKGDAIKINTGSYNKMPATIMEELRLKGVGMVITSNGEKQITIPAGKAKNAENGRHFWPLSQLTELYKNYTFTEKPNKQNPSTNGYGYTDTNTGITEPVLGAVVEVAKPQTQQASVIIFAAAAVALGAFVLKKKNEFENSKEND